MHLSKVDLPPINSFSAEIFWHCERNLDYWGCRVYVSYYAEAQLWGVSYRWANWSRDIPSKESIDCGLRVCISALKIKLVIGLFKWVTYHLSSFLVRVISPRVFDRCKRSEVGVWVVLSCEEGTSGRREFPHHLLALLTASLLVLCLLKQLNFWEA